MTPRPLIVGTGLTARSRRHVARLLGVRELDPHADVVDLHDPRPWHRIGRTPPRDPAMRARARAHRLNLGQRPTLILGRRAATAITADPWPWLTWRGELLLAPSPATTNRWWNDHWQTVAAAAAMRAILPAHQAASVAPPPAWCVPYAHQATSLDGRCPDHDVPLTPLRHGRPDVLAAGDPGYGRECPGCGGAKTVDKRWCLDCRRRANWTGVAGRQTRNLSAIDERTLGVVWQLRYEQGATVGQIARAVLPATRYANLHACTEGLRSLLARRERNDPAWSVDAPPRSCVGHKANGAPCQNTPPDGEERCWAHDPLKRGEHMARVRLMTSRQGRWAA